MSIDVKEFHWLADMLESVEVGLVILDLDYRVQAWNGFMANHSGINAHRIRDRILFDAFPELPQTWLERKIETVIQLNVRAFTSWEQRPYLFRFRNSRPITGIDEFMYQNLTISPISGPDGAVEKICLMIYDVTEIASGRLALEKANALLAKLSKTDRLTGLLNRGTWEQLLDVEFERFRRYAHDTSLVMLDIDHFKSVNDNHGHVVGDDVIRHTAELIRRNLRGSDVAGRYGGEEFGIIMPETDTDGAIALCERIRASVEASVISTASGGLTYTISLGVATLDGDVDNYMSWVEQADRALYAAKEGGRNQVRAHPV
ncbi:MAG: GGDEF domain-containing protein [Marinobacter sp.]|nr:GGDEF domain-containing protein [Marinobacter sp.]